MSVNFFAAPSNKSDFAGYGFAAGDVRGTRAWKVDRLGRLTGVVHAQVWRPGENLAECKRTRPKTRSVRPADYDMTTRCYCGNPGCTLDPNGLISTTYANTSMFRTMMYNEPEMEPDPCFVQGVTSMDPNCACGLYAYQEGSNDYYKPGDGKPVGGVVRGYGKTVLGTRGFRSEKAEILALYVDDADLTGAGLKYRIERNYTGIPVFTDYAKLLAEFPPTLPEIGGPADEDFWTRSVS